MTENVCVINSIVMSCTYVTHFIGYGTHDNTTQSVFGKVNTGFDNIYMKNRKTFRLYNKWMLVTVEIEMGKWLIVFLVYNKRVFFCSIQSGCHELIEYFVSRNEWVCFLKIKFVNLNPIQN